MRSFCVIFSRLSCLEWRRLAELPSGKNALATPAQRQMLTDHGIPYDEFITKYQVKILMESRPIVRPESRRPGDT